MVNIKDKLNGKILILGIGNSMKGDDGAGPALASMVKNGINAGVAPENYTGEIKRMKPDTLVMVDAIDFGGKPGCVRIIDEGKIGNISLSTHNISLKTFTSYLKSEMPRLNILLIGIQPKQCGLGEELSSEVKESINNICTSLL